MKTFFTIIFLFSLSFCFAQSAPKKESKATITVLPNQIQSEKLDAALKEKQAVENKVNELVEITIGYKLEDVDSLRVENGQFKFVLKLKKK